MARRSRISTSCEEDFERAAIVQMETTARAHYVDGLLRLVLYSWVEFTKWSLGTAHAHLEKQEVAGDPADDLSGNSSRLSAQFHFQL